jgi:pimeloyl-ACP methyl ester carboxylesterase
MKREGEAVMGEPLVLLPGLLCNERLFAAQAAELGRDRRVTVADLRQDTSMADMAERVLADAPARFALCGLSMGGYLALLIALTAPERVTRLAVLNGQARADAPDALARRTAQMGLAESGRFDEVPEQLLPLFLHADRLADPGLCDTVRAMAAEVGPEAFVRQQRALMGRTDLRPRLEAIRCPALLLSGRHDRLIPPERTEEIAASIPGATYVLLGRCGHLSTLERPEAVNGQLEAWLAWG